MNIIQTILDLLTSTLPLTMALTLGVTEVIKRGFGWEKEENAHNKRYLPMVSVLIGIGFGTLLISADRTGIVIGLIAGLSASGIWDFGSNAIDLIRPKK